jgi:alkylated DNA nucleotide flippase Atl1
MPKKPYKSWQEKLEDSKGLPKVVELNEKMIQKWGSGTLVVPAPKEVDEIMHQVPEGKVITIHQIREVLAKKHKASIGCPLTTGIFAWIAAHAAEEAASEGKQDITPYWRTLKSDGELNEKYPGGVRAQAKRLEAEGHQIVLGKGKNQLKVKDFEKFLVEL